MRKAILKRIKMTRTGKLLHRKPGQNHFRAKASRKVQRRQKQIVGFSKTMEKKMRAYLT